MKLTQTSKFGNFEITKIYSKGECKEFQKMTLQLAIIENN